jgi:proteasome lid subunit RPN8/RPN11
MVILPKVLYEQICRHAEGVYPAECCGLLLGEVEGGVKSIREIRETENIAHNQMNKRYCIPPKALLDAENYVREKGWQVIGAYHSHPDHSSKPSEFDRKRALVHFEYIIVSIQGGRVDEMACWVLHDWSASFEREELSTSN